MNINQLKLALFEEFKDLNNYQMQIIFSIIQNCASGYYLHRSHITKDSNIFAIDNNLIRNIHKIKGKSIIKRFFDVHSEYYHFSKTHSVTKAYVFNKKLQNLLSVFETINIDEITANINGNNKMNKIKINAQRTGQAILHLTDLYNMNSPKAFEIYNQTYKPKEPLRAGQLFHYSRKELYFRRNKLMFIAQDVNWQEYKESKTGRLFQSDPVNFQHLNSELRKIVLGGIGYFDYDIENCHYSILIQVLNKNKIDTKEFPTINCYLKNKVKFRNELAEEWCININSVKKILISLINGGAIKFMSRTFINLEKDSIKKIFASNTYKRLKDELNLAKTYLLDVYSTVSDEIKKKLLAYILQGIESQILETVDNKYNCILKIHDGWILEKNIPTIQITKYIEQETGFKLKIRKEEL